MHSRRRKEGDLVWKCREGKNMRGACARVATRGKRRPITTYRIDPVTALLRLFVERCEAPPLGVAPNSKPQILQQHVRHPAPAHVMQKQKFSTHKIILSLRARACHQFLAHITSCVCLLMMGVGFQSHLELT